MAFLISSLVHSRTGDWSMTLIPIEKFRDEEICWDHGLHWGLDREEELRRWHDAMPKLPIWFEDFNEASVMFLMDELKGNL